LPSYVQQELEGSKKYYEENGKCVFCEILRVEKENNGRIIYENEHFMVFTFFAARFPFEMWVMPKKHEPNFEQMSSETQDSLADAMQNAIKKLNKTLNFPSFNYWVHTAPHRQAGVCDHYHWHVEIAPRVSSFGGYELGSGVVIDVVSPEAAAAFLKKE